MSNDLTEKNTALASHRGLVGGTTSQPLVTVIIPSYNHERYIKQSILSVVTQTYKEIQLIVIDDGSKDDSLKIINELAEIHGFEVVARENRGLAKTLNEGIALARGKYISFLASDDFYLPQRIEKAVLYFELTASNVAAIYCDGLIVNDNGKRVGLFGEKYARPITGGTYDNLLVGNWIPALGVTYKIDVLKSFMFDEKFKVEDYTLYLRMFKSGKHRLDYYDDFGFAYRWHDSNFSKITDQMKSELNLIHYHFSDVASHNNFKQQLKAGELFGGEIVKLNNYYLLFLQVIRKLQSRSKTYHQNIFGLFLYFFDRALRLLKERVNGFRYFGFEGLKKGIRVSGCVFFRGRKSNFQFGENCRILGNLHLVLSDSWQIRPSIVIGDDATIDDGVYMNSHGGAIITGNSCHFGVSSVIQAGGELVIGDDVLLGPGVKIFASNHNYGTPNQRLSETGESFKGVTIGSNVWVGADCVILDGSILGDWTVFGAGSVVCGKYEARTRNIAKSVRASSVPKS